MWRRRAEHVEGERMKERLWKTAYVIAVLGMGVLVAGVFATQSKPESTQGPAAVGEWMITWSSTDTVAVHNSTHEELRFGPLVSIVGPVLSYVDSYVSEGGAHPSSGCSLQSVILGEKQSRAMITEILEEDEVVLALVNAWPVMTDLELRGPASLAELQERLVFSCAVDWEDLPFSFAVMDLRNDAAVVRFGLGHGCEAARGNNTQFDVLIPVPVDRQAWFRDAVAQQTLGMTETCGGTHEWRCCLEWNK
jgi:hypothetical protein